ncbi:MAG: glycosyltransferase family 4 protein, partial [Verrucomicrobiota bacterium]
TEEMEVPRRFANHEIDVSCLPGLGREIHPWRDFKTVLAMRREMRRFDPDLISLHASKAGALGRVAALGLGTPVLYTPHCWSFVEGFSKARFYEWVERILAPAATRIVTVSEDEREFGLSRGVGRPDSTLTIHNGVRDRFPSEVNWEARGNGDSLRLVMVGRFEDQKDQQLLLRALATLRDFPWRITFIGDGPLQKGCQDLSRDLGIVDRVDFAGYSDAVDEVLTKNDLFLLVTNWEGFPRSILEAMAASLPVVATDVGGSRESVLDGVTGHLVQKGDVGSLTEVLRKLFQNPELMHQMGRDGRERFLQLFTLERMTSEYLRLYREVIGFGSVESADPASPTESEVPAHAAIPAARAASRIHTTH